MSKPDEGGGYRPDIDGLRAVAVLAVVVYHARASLLPGGFVGVDIFFVISGFLISGIIFTRIDRGVFSLLDFYRRRVQRIAPAMFVVVAATLAAGYWLLLPRDATGLARSAVFSVGSLANVYFWLYQDQGYFAADSRELPLLHLWSLGVEEQFYMVWPLVLMAIGQRWRSRAFLIWSTAAAAASFVLGDLLFSWDPSFVYYLMPTRAGELLVGAIVSALVLGGASTLASRHRSLAGLAGATAIALSLFLYSDTTIFPGVRAMLPTVGAAALLLAGSRPGGGPVTRLLATKPLVAIGLISYSVYLWHWPLMAFYRYGFGELSPPAQWLMPVFAIVLGGISYALVEQPARALRMPPLRTIVVGYAVPGAVVVAAALLIVQGPRLGIPLRDARYMAALRELNDKTRAAFTFDYVCQKQLLQASDFTDRRCVVGPTNGGEPRVMLWGDSNAAHYIGILGRAAERAGFRFRNAEIGSCPPVSTDPVPFVEPRRARDCRASLAAGWPAVEHFPVVILGASWSTYDKASPAFFPAIADTVNRLLQRGAFVLLLGKMPTVEGYDARCPQKQLTFPFLSCPVLRRPLSDEVKAANTTLSGLARGHERVAYFDMTPYMCTDGGCQSIGSDGEPLYFDESHISMAASWKLGTEIMKANGMPPALSALADAARAAAD